MRSSAVPGKSVAIITPSYSNDFELAADLCASIDRYARFDYEHILIVPKRDLALFSGLAGPRRRVLSRESILRRHGFHRLPLPTIVRLPFGKARRLREQYYLSGVGRVSGWLVQQIVKLAAADYTDADLFIFADSDVLLIRPFELTELETDGRLNLQQHVKGRDLATHKLWRATAHRLLDIQPKATEPFNYIGQLVPWTRATLDGLLRRIEEVGGGDWRRTIAKAKTVSEYILYGEYVVEAVPEAERPATLDMRLCNSVWSPDAEIDAGSILAAMEPQHIALHIQSTNPIPVETRREAIRTITSRMDMPSIV